VYPQFVLHAADAAKAECNIARLGRNVNDAMPAYCVSEALKLAGIEPAQCRVAVLGLAFRGGVSDTRLSPTYSVVSELKKAGVKDITVHDPMVKSDPALGSALTQDLRAALRDASLVILATDHKEYQKLSRRDTGEAAVYDGRGMLDRSKFGRFASIGRRT
jgi:UDP-N-acetyl-D-mannosaminuronate dehydrogenase